MSAWPPEENVNSRRIGFAGYCAYADAAKPNAAAAAASLSWER
jgi:hypothetical protein